MLQEFRKLNKGSYSWPRWADKSGSSWHSCRTFVTSRTLKNERFSKATCFILCSFHLRSYLATGKTDLQFGLGDPFLLLAQGILSLPVMHPNHSKMFRQKVLHIHLQNHMTPVPLLHLARLFHWDLVVLDKPVRKR